MCFYANYLFAHGLPDQKEIYKYAKENLTKLQIYEKPREAHRLIVFNESDNVEELDLTFEKVLVVNFWATWCAPCREEMPSLQRLAESFSAKPFSVITIASGRQSKKMIAEFFLDQGISSLPKYRDPKGKLAASFGVYGLPTTIIINQHYEEIGRLVGSTNWNSDEVKEILNLVISAHSN